MPFPRLNRSIFGAFAATMLPVLASAAVDFEKEVQPIFREHCLGCHGAEKQKGDYRLDVRDVALRGGESGEAAITPGKADTSALLERVVSRDPDLQMPPKKSDRQPLSAAQIATLRTWIEEGATWPDSANVAAKDPRDWWSLKPVVRPAQPADGHPIDAFVRTKLTEQKLAPSPPADARTLCRRLYFDLTGLPPTPEEVAAFETESIRDPQSAIRHLTDRLLASPRYGERWARHWLDVVHFGETHGYDKDKPRLNAWPYRDYVIRAFNEDKPYARFVEEQLAGDVLFPDTSDGIEALGFIAAGPWDLIGHAEVPETKIDGKIARHLDRDDMVSNTINTFCSLTVHCAQCHNHKFDPISQEDYYSLQAVFAALDRADKPYFANAALTRRYGELQREKRSSSDALAAIDKAAATAAGSELTALDTRIEQAKKSVKGNPTPAFGYHSQISPTQDVTKWVQVDLGRRVEIDRIVLLPAYDDFGKIGAGFGFPVRFKVEVSDDPDFRTEVALVWRHHDRTFMQDFPNPGLTPFTTGGASGDFQARYVRVTATKLATRRNDFIFALAELQVIDPAGKNVALGAKVSAVDSIEAAPRWGRANLVDGHAPTAPDTNTEDVAALTARRAALLDAKLNEKQRADRARLTERVAAIDKELAAFPKPQTAYVGTVHHGAGTFVGTGANGGRPRPIAVLARGDVTKPGKLVSPGAISALAELPGRFSVANDAPEGERRAALARWITDPRNPLTWRSIVNRVWQYHFGRGLADSPNDFGRMGLPPSHPELLDWLAAEFRDSGGSFKKLHRLIVTSGTYQQSSVSRPDFAALDGGNALLWRQNRRKLEAEAIRDSLLAVAGKLDLKMGGPSFQDFVIEKPQHSPHYEYHLADPENPELHRRSIYRFLVRSQQQPFMAALDCADPSMLVDKRNQTLTPLQALAQLNNQLALVMAKHFATRVENAGESMEAKVAHAFRVALSREPSNTELRELTAFATRFGLSNACRAILNLNEFAFVD